jgi:hypothetical protein
VHSAHGICQLGIPQAHCWAVTFTGQSRPMMLEQLPASGVAGIKSTSPATLPPFQGQAERPPHSEGLLQEPLAYSGGSGDLEGGDQRMEMHRTSRGTVVNAAPDHQ